MQIVVNVAQDPQGRLMVNLATTFGQDAAKVLAILEIARQMLTQQVLQSMGQPPQILIARGVLPGGGGYGGGA
jgi:hypothetical protein